MPKPHPMQKDLVEEAVQHADHCLRVSLDGFCRYLVWSCCLPVLEGLDRFSYLCLPGFLTVDRQEVESFAYLGNVMDQQGGMEQDVPARIGKARAAFVKQKKILASREIHMDMVHILNSNIKQALSWNPRGKRRRGRPRNSWRRNTERKLSELGMRWEDVKREAQN
ncbi:hypothetical protein Bbelb_308920 [Branchiostoma belcheri]|nr:hypothetical protein Bbelb_308920 [Branchiostoma belcheri]